MQITTDITSSSKNSFRHQFGFFYKPQEKKFEISSFKTAQIYFDQIQLFQIAKYLEDIESNRWIRLYYGSHYTVAFVVFLVGIALFFTVVFLIAGVVLACVILCQKERYYGYTLRKSVESLQIIERAH